VNGTVGLFVVYAVGTLVGFLWGAWWSRKALHKAEATYQASAYLLRLAQLVLKGVEGQKKPDDAP
jgi:hypothetical protein